ncbi:hypothetical protein JOQ06_010770 [Pogonophryne albipinna]|uniref:Uncharacterized protein n=1 Tax=Pogonophryne albipinna TaxID=1090488 RepID=A0AAD6AYC5_9TELE|nr:hypothetical protein JOQ06_010770 [Pogonophryne albipinna]
MGPNLRPRWDPSCGPDGTHPEAPMGPILRPRWDPSCGPDGTPLERLAVCLEESIYIHNIKDMKLLKTLLNTPSNPSGLCALSINHSNSYLAYPGSATTGEIIVYDSNNLVKNI